jgi:hypothetical protein
LFLSAYNINAIGYRKSTGKERDLPNKEQFDPSRTKLRSRLMKAKNDEERIRIIENDPIEKFIRRMEEKTHPESKKRTEFTSGGEMKLTEQLGSDINTHKSKKHYEGINDEVFEKILEDLEPYFKKDITDKTGNCAFTLDTVGANRVIKDFFKNIADKYDVPWNEVQNIAIDYRDQNGWISPSKINKDLPEGWDEDGNLTKSSGMADFNNFNEMIHFSYQYEFMKWGKMSVKMVADKIMEFVTTDPSDKLEDKVYCEQSKEIVTTNVRGYMYSEDFLIRVAKGVMGVQETYLQQDPPKRDPNYVKVEKDIEGVIGLIKQYYIIANAEEEQINLMLDEILKELNRRRFN